MHFRLIISILTLLIFIIFITGAAWIYTRDFAGESKAIAEMSRMEKDSENRPDPGVTRFDQAIGLIKKGEMIAGRDNLLELVRVYRDSSRFEESKRVIGEINMDMLLSADEQPYKKNYIVQRGDSLARIAKKHNSTIAYIMRSTGLFSHRIHPGDTIVVAPLDFEVVVDRKTMRLILMRKGRFFKEYALPELRLPPRVRIPLSTTINKRVAWLNGKMISISNPLYGTTDKWIQTEKAGVMLASLTDDSGASKRNQDAEEVLNYGIFLKVEDIEELATVIPIPTPLKVIN